MIDEIRSSSNLSRSLIVCRPLLGFSKRCRVSPFKTRRNALFDLIGRRTCLSSFDEAGKKTGSLCDLFPPLGQLTHGKTPDDKTRPVSHVENETTTATKKKRLSGKGFLGLCIYFLGSFSPSLRMLLLLRIGRLKWMKRLRAERVSTLVFYRHWGVWEALPFHFLVCFRLVPMPLRVFIPFQQIFIYIYI